MQPAAPRSTVGGWLASAVRPQSGEVEHLLAVVVPGQLFDLLDRPLQPARDLKHGAQIKGVIQPTLLATERLSLLRSTPRDWSQSRSGALSCWWQASSQRFQSSSW